MDINILRNDYPEASAHEETPHGCWDGLVYMGFEGEDANGEYVEVIERAPCRRYHGCGEKVGG